MSKLGKLTIKQENFCLEIIKGANASDAYRSAYNCKRMKPTSINRLAKAMMDNIKIASRIDELRAPVIKAAQIDATYVLNRLSAIDEMDLLDIMHDDLTLKPLSEWPKIWRQFVSGIDLHELRAGQGSAEAAIAFIKKLKWPDKVKNLELIGKHVTVQAFKEKLDVEVKNPPVFNLILQGEPHRGEDGSETPA